MYKRIVSDLFHQWNPFVSVDSRISITTTIVYVAAVTAVIASSIRLPPLPTGSESLKGINISEAWHDLDHLSQRFHPYNSYDLDPVHDWLVQRIKSILANNNADAHSAYVFDDQVSNLTFHSVKKYRPRPISAYFEAKNVVTYIRGTNDDQSDWWETPSARPSHNHSILIDAHYDSTPTEYGATDDGVGVISMLQLIRYFTTNGNTPKYGIVFLMNSGEENGLNGARAFSQHPMSRAVSRFVNLEGAGAGGRAAAFRMTDVELTTAYAKSPYPFGNVASAEAFDRGVIKSGTDYTVLNKILGYQGIDIAFIGPRARYHTNEDDIRHTSKRSVWHMLSAVLATTKALSEDPPNKQVDNHVIWFDILGRKAIVMHENTWFRLSMTILFAGPVILLLSLTILSRREGRVFSMASQHGMTIDIESLQRLRHNLPSFLVFPLILFASSATPMGVGLAIYKSNPLIVYRSQWIVWVSLVSSFVVVAWYFIHSTKGPSTLVRACAFTWISAGWWFILFAATVLLKLLKSYALYFTLFYFAASLMATLLSYLDLFSAVTKLNTSSPSPGSRHSTSRIVRLLEKISVFSKISDEVEVCKEKVTETSALLSSADPMIDGHLRTDSRREEENSDAERTSMVLANWIWVLELLVVVPPTVILVGQVGTYFVDSVHQTSSDGSSPRTAYLGMALLTPFIFTPLTAFLNAFPRRFAWVLLLIFLGSLAHNMTASPFDSDNRVKFSFQQQLDLDNNTSVAKVVGVRGYLQEALSTLPSMPADGPTCEPYEEETLRYVCRWNCSIPSLTKNRQSPTTESIDRKLVQFSTTLINDETENKTVRFEVFGQNTRACKLMFDSNITSFHVAGQGPVDERFRPVPIEGGDEVRLWSRTWNRTWVIDVTWPPEALGWNKTGNVTCLWSDANQVGTIPVYDDLIRGLPSWATVMSLGDGLVEAFHTFKI